MRSERNISNDGTMVPFAQLLAEPVRNGIYKKKEFHGSGVKIVNMGELSHTHDSETCICDE